MNVWELCSPPFVQIDRAVGSKNGGIELVLEWNGGME